MNFRPITNFCFPVVFALACGAGLASADPLILAQPTSQSVFNGDTSVTFEVLATGTPALRAAA
jgi:hypothetical protein